MWQQIFIANKDDEDKHKKAQALNCMNIPQEDCIIKGILFIEGHIYDNISRVSLCCAFKQKK